MMLSTYPNTLLSKELLNLQYNSTSDRPIINYNSAWDEFEQLIDKSTVDTGIADMAHQHTLVIFKEFKVY